MNPFQTQSKDPEVSTADRPSAPKTVSDRQPTSERRAEADGHSVVLSDLHAYYGNLAAVRGIDIEFPAGEVTAIIGPSGCGKSTMVRCINRMHEEIPGATARGTVRLDDLDVYDPSVDVTVVRRLIGMVFQKPNPFPTMSIFDNVAAGLRLTGTKSHDEGQLGEHSLQAAGLWDAVKDRLSEPGIGLSGGQQQPL